MNYHTQYDRAPDQGLATDLVDYLTKDIGRGGVIVDRAGQVDEDRAESFAGAATRQEMVRQHTAAFSEEHDVDDLADAARDVAREHLDGMWVAGIHVSNPGNPHIHIAEAGGEDELWMDRQDIEALRSDLAGRLGEPYGDLS